MNDSALLREKRVSPKGEVIPWPELAQRVNKFAYMAMNREFDSKEGVLERVADVQHFIRTFCPESSSHAAVLEGALWAHVTDRFEDTTSYDARTFVIESNIRAQHGLMEMRNIPYEQRIEFDHALYAGSDGERRMMYLRGALSVARVAIAVESLGHTFEISSMEEDRIGGIDGWLLRKGSPRIPMDIKSRTDPESGYLVKPHSLSNKIKHGVQCRQRKLLEDMGLEPRLLQCFVPCTELGTMYVMQPKGPLTEPLRQALVKWHRSPYSLRGNPNHPRLPRIRRH